MSYQRFVPIVVVVLLTACHPSDGDQTFTSATERTSDIWTVDVDDCMRSRILMFVNDSTTSYNDLRDAGVHWSGASNIIAHRDGPDGLPGTADDRPIANLEELDSINGVGPSSLDNLREFVEPLCSLAASALLTCRNVKLGELADQLWVTATDDGGFLAEYVRHEGDGWSYTTLGRFDDCLASPQDRRVVTCFAEEDPNPDHWLSVTRLTHAQLPIGATDPQLVTYERWNVAVRSTQIGGTVKTPERDDFDWAGEDDCLASLSHRTAPPRPSSEIAYNSSDVCNDGWCD